MIIIEPITIGDGELTASNVVYDSPRGSSVESYDAWDASTTYDPNDVVCSIDEETITGLWHTFRVYSAIYGSVNREPDKTTTDSDTLPGKDWWKREGAFAPKYNQFYTYSAGFIVGHINGSTGAFYESLVSGNKGNSPNSSPSHWRQTSFNSYEEWDDGTTYAEGVRVVILSGPSNTTASIYTSLQSGNLNKPPASETDWWQFDGDTYTLWETATSYAVGATVLDLRTRHEYESLVGSNMGNDPTTDSGSNWLDLGVANRWRMFDVTNTRATTGAEQIDVTLQPGTACDALALMNLTAQEVQIIATSDEVEVYNETFNLTDPGMITDWRKYFFDPLTYKSDLIVTDLPLYTDLHVRVIITNSGGLASCGLCVIGKSFEVGATVYGASVSYTDYSRYDLNEFGDQFNFVPRGFSKTGQFDVVVDKASHDTVYNLLVRRRGKFSVFIGSGDYSSTWIGGFPREPRLAIDYPEQSKLSIELVGIP
ncbi:MAG: hypothetical protein WCY32_13880 [Burkholderiaceae bacterium]